MSSSATYFLSPSSAGATAGSGQAAITKPRRWIDAATRDYVVEGGDFKQDDGFTSKVVLALSTRLGSCQALSAFGSRIHEIKTADERGRRLAESYALMACAHLAEEVQDLAAAAYLPKNAPGRIDYVVSGRRGMTLLAATYSASI